jgi:hypothetical protein
LPEKKETPQLSTPENEEEPKEGSKEDDPRQSLADGLSAFLTRSQIDALLNEALALKKESWINCPACKKRAKVEIPDAKAVVDSVSSLLVQGFGRPSEQRGDTTLVVNRKVELICDCGHPCEQCAAGCESEVDEIHE